MINNVLRALLLVLGVFVLCLLVLLIVNTRQPAALRWAFAGLLKSAGGTALLTLPGFVWLAWRYFPRQEFSAVSVEDVLLDKSQLQEAVDFWLYIKKKSRIEGSVAFSMKDDGSPQCHVTVQKED